MTSGEIRRLASDCRRGGASYLGAKLETIANTIEAYEGMKDGVSIRIADLERELAKARDAMTINDEQHQRVNADLLRQLSMHAAAQGKDYWIWQGDGEDHMESLTCPILIRPEQLRGEFDKLDRECQEAIDSCCRRD